MRCFIRTPNTAEGRWVSAGVSTTKHWLHPYLNGDAPLERSCGQSIRINGYEFVAALRGNAGGVQTEEKETTWLLMSY